MLACSSAPRQLPSAMRKPAPPPSLDRMGCVRTEWAAYTLQRHHTRTHAPARARGSVIGADVFNEPTGGTWAEGKPTDFDAFAVAAARAIHSDAPGWLIFVQGTQNSPDCSHLIDDLVEDVFNGTANTCHAGDNLLGAQQRPIVLDVPERLVYSPHMYGPAVQTRTPEFKSAAFPDNLIEVWKRRFGLLVSKQTRKTPAVVIGEWGGPVEGSNEVWMLALMAYLKKQKLCSNFFWHLGMDGAPVGLVLDWTLRDARRYPLPPTVDHAKVRLLEQLVPNPTRVPREGAVAAANAERKKRGKQERAACKAGAKGPVCDAWRAEEKGKEDRMRWADQAEKRAEKGAAGTMWPLLTS